MAPVAYGFRGHFGFAEESTYGTPVARTNWLEINNESLEKQVGRIESASLPRRGILNTRVIDGGIGVAGEVEFDAQYDGWLKLAKHAFGAVVTTQPDAGGAPTAYQHKFTIADSLPTGLTMEAFRDTTDFAGGDQNKAFVYTGCKISGMEFSAQVGELLKVKAGVIGQNETPAAKSTPTYNTSTLAVYHQGVITWNGGDIEVSNFTIQLNNNLNGRPKLGSNLTREPAIDGKVDVTGTFTMEFKDLAMYTDFTATTQRVFQALFTGPLIASTTYYTVKLVVNVALLHNWKVLLNTTGRLIVEAQFKAYRSASLNELELYLINTTTSV